MKFLDELLSPPSIGRVNFSLEESILAEGIVYRCDQWKGKGHVLSWSLSEMGTSPRKACSFLGLGQATQLG